MRDRRDHLVGIDERRSLSLPAKRGRERDRQFGGTGAGRAANGEEPPAPQSISVGHRSRNSLPVDGSFERADRGRGLIAFGRKDGERVDELRHGGVRRNHPVDAQRGEELATRWFLGIEDAEQAAAAPVNRLDERPRQPGPTMAHDERAVLLVEREHRVHDDLADSRAAVIGEVAMQALDPCLRREDERDLRLGHPYRPLAPADASTGNGGVASAGRDPVVLVITMSPPAIPAATSCDSRASTASVTVNLLSTPPNAPPRSGRPTLRTSASATTIDTS